MGIKYDAFPELAATILDWWETIALAFNILGLLVNFFFTMHKGAKYRAAFVMLLIALLTLLYVDVITPANPRIQADDMIRPIMYTAWAYTVWTRAWLYLDYFIEYKSQYEMTIEKVLSLENTVVPWKETALYAKELERWQKWMAGAIATVFAVGLLYSNINRIEEKQVVYIQTSQVAAQNDASEKASRDSIAAALRKKNITDSLYQAYMSKKVIEQNDKLNSLEKQAKKKQIVRPVIVRPAPIFINQPQPKASVLPVNTPSLEGKVQPVPNMRRGRKLGYSEVDTSGAYYVKNQE